MRMYQEFGLSLEAEIWLDKNCQKEGYDFCPHCEKATKQGLRVIDRSEQEDHFYGDGPTYLTYITNDNRKVKEVCQAEPWFSGPCHFRCLELEDGTRIGEWSEEEIENC